MRVLKFGGTSMDDEHSWKRVLDIIAGYDQPFVIVSATARTTRQLLSAAEKAVQNMDQSRQIAAQIRERHRLLVRNFITHFAKDESDVLPECERWIDKKINELEGFLSEINENQKLDGRLKDAVASIGERLSSYLFAQCTVLYGHSARWIDAADIVRTNSDFERAAPDTGFINRQAGILRQNADEGEILIMGGYYGQDKKGNTTTLGFEGSDYSASLTGAAFSAEAIEIWTDVSGIYTCDPRVVSGARPIPELSFQEATELAYFGAKVLHPSTTKPAAQQHIPIYVKNIFEPYHPGTCITDKIRSNGIAKAMTFKKECIIITLTSANTVMGYKFLADVFDILKIHHLPVDVVTTTEASVSIALENKESVETVIQELRRRGSVEVKDKQAVISLVGCKSQKIPLLINRVLAALNGDVLNLVSFSRSKHNLNVVIDQESVVKSVRGIHEQVFEG